jgi:hypothetical protein
VRAALAALLIASVAIADSPAVAVDGGCFLPAEKCISTAQELARLRAENESLRKSAQPSMSTAVVAVLVAIAGALGAGAGRATCK